MGFLSICAFFGGISFGQVANLFAVTAASGVAGGALGLLVALWRDRTFQSIALTILMVVFSIAGVEAFAIAFPTLEFLGVPILWKSSIRIYAMIAVLYPQADQMTGVVRASSLVYIGARLTFAAALVAFGTFMLRKWNPGTNEPRELREEGEVEAVESLVEITEENAQEAVGVGSGARAHAGESAVAVSDPPRVTAIAAMATTGEANRRRPRRSHDRASRSPAARIGESGPKRGHTAIPGPTLILWRELMTRAHGTKSSLIIKGCYVLLFLLGMGLFFNIGGGARKSAPVDTRRDSDRLDDSEPRADQCAGCHRPHERAATPMHSIYYWSLS